MPAIDREILSAESFYREILSLLLFNNAVSLCVLHICEVKLSIFCFSLCLRVALETLDRLTESLDFTDYASRIIHPIVRTLDSTPELRSTSMDTLSSLVFQLGKKVAVAVLWAYFICGYY